MITHKTRLSVLNAAMIDDLDVRGRVELSPICAHAQPFCTPQGVCGMFVALFLRNTEAQRAGHDVITEHGFCVEPLGNYVLVPHTEYERFLEVLEAADVAYWIAFQ